MISILKKLLALVAAVEASSLCLVLAYVWRGEYLFWPFIALFLIFSIAALAIGRASRLELDALERSIAALGKATKGMTIKSFTIDGQSFASVKDAVEVAR